MNKFTAKETAIARKVLDYLHGLDGGQAHAFTIQAELGGLELCSAQEFEDILGRMNQQKLVIFVDTKFKGRLWSITEAAGEAARLQM